MDATESPGPVSGRQLSSPFKLFSAAWPLYKNKLTTFILLTLIGIAVFLAALLIPIGMIIVGSMLFPALKGPLTGILIIAAFFASFYSICRFQLALVTAVVKESCGVGEAIRVSKNGILSFFWLGLLNAFILFGGYLFFIIPGILFSIWFCFWPYVFAVQRLKGMDCLFAGKALISGKGWAVFGRLLFAWVVTIIISLIPVLGPILGVLLIPFNMIYVYLLYQELSAGQNPASPRASAGTKASVLLVSALGFIVIPALTALMLFTLFKGMLAGAHIDLKHISFGKGRSNFTVKSTPPSRSPALPAVRVDRPLSLASTGFATKEDLFTALKDAVKDHDVKKFAACFASVGLDPSADSGLVEIAQYMFRQNVTRVWIPDKESLAYRNLQKRYASYSTNIPVDGYIRFNFENDTNKSQNFLYGQYNGKYYLAYAPADSSFRSAKNASQSGSAMSDLINKAKEKLKSASSPARSTSLMHELILKNGQVLKCSIVERDPKGIWVETAPGVRSYWTNAEVVKTTELNKPSEVTETPVEAETEETPTSVKETTARVNQAQGLAPAPLPQAEAPPAPVPGYETHLTYARQVIEAMDQSKWNEETMRKYSCNSTGKANDFTLKIYKEMADADGIQDYLKIEQKMCDKVGNDKACWVNFKLLFHGLYPRGRPGSHRAANVGLYIIQHEDGTCCVNGTSLNPYST